jgi:hypothetical protein
MLMDYKLIYEKIVARNKNKISTSEEYTEKHHIIPRCMGGGDEKENIVVLTPEEHYVCHQLLVKIYPEHVGLWRAVYMMTHGSKSHGEHRKSNKLYGWLKRNNKWVNRVNVKCKNCKKEFSVLECHKRKFCSQACKSRTQENKIVKKCKHCENDFFVNACEDKKRKYCTPKCSSLSQIKILIKNCKNCKKEFCGEPNLISKRTFCSLKCAWDSQKGKKRFVPERVPIMSKPCKYCGELMYGKPGKLKQKKSCGRNCVAKTHRK